MTPLGTIEQEAAACRAAWKAKPRARYGVHIHHEMVVEPLTEPIEARITYILTHKPEAEQALRLRLMRPVTVAALSAYQEATVAALSAYEEATAPAWSAYEEATAAAHAALCPTPDCPWDRESIFGGKS